MKEFATTFLLILLASVAFSQSTYKLEKIDSIPKTKSQLYSDTKMFISEYWKSAQDVIQNDDKEGGMILLKGKSIQKMNFMLIDHTWIYSYTVKFMMKEGKYRVVIENVSCIDAYAGANKWPLIDFCDGCEFPGYMKTSLKKEKWEELMGNLKSEFEGIANNYEKYVKSTSTEESDW